MIIYFAQFHKNKHNQFEVSFPDLAPYAATYGDTIEEAIKSANDSLTGYLLTAKESGEKVAEPSSAEKLIKKLPKNDFLVVVKANTNADNN